jgi:HEAT repeat protein
MNLEVSVDSIENLLKRLASPDEEERRQAVSTLARFPFERIKHLALAALGDESWRVRKEAVDLILSVSPGEELSREMVSLLIVQENAGLRNSVVEVLQTVGEKVIPLLVEHLAHEDAGVRKFIVDIMGGIGSPVVLPELAAALADSDPNVAAAAAESLGTIGDSGAVPYLLMTLERDDLLIRYAILEALVKIGMPVPLAAVTPLAGDPLLKKALFECLGVIGDLASVAMLSGGLVDRARNVREAALTALDMIRQRSSAADFTNFAAGRLKEFAGTDAVEYLIAMAGSSDLKIQRAALSLLGFVGDLRALDVFIKGCRNENLQQQALEAIRTLGPAAGAALLQRFNRAEEEERCIIVYIAGEVIAPESRCIATAGLDDLSDMVRALAAEAIGKAGLTELIPLLVKLLNDNSHEVRKRATTALVRLATVARESVLESAIMLAESDNPDYRLQAIKLFKASKEVGQIIFLSKDEDYLVRREAIIALGEMKNPDTSGRLAMALADEEADVRLAAATALGWDGFSDESGALLLALADPSQRVQAAALKSLGRRREPSCFDSVAKFAGADSGMLKITALQAMVQIDPAKAAEFLELAMKDPDEEVAVVANLLDTVSERH